MWAILLQCKTLNFGTQVYYEVLAPSQMGEGNSLYKTNNIWHQHADNRKWYDLLLCQHLVQLLILLIRKTRAFWTFSCRCCMSRLCYMMLVPHAATLRWGQLQETSLWLKRAFKPHLSWSWFSCNDRSKQAQIQQQRLQSFHWWHFYKKHFGGAGIAC